MRAIQQMSLGELADRQCLQQAVWVALERHVDWDEIERWSRQEGEMEKFEAFRRKFEGESQR